MGLVSQPACNPADVLLEIANCDAQYVLENSSGQEEDEHNEEATTTGLGMVPNELVVCVDNETPEHT
eukprot:CAMPEP_0185746882 /NCGR_PEP_ID=MMETSP1174-20130828/5544_1 /TAXON_ID=35687 /ORGANISM="Dictyocha speculum, Strain CCMP1381" /LENGTH=66 /DNA_ID=CAMNT_0028421819 /DNA_START=98 /DNA_END=295 /DNA_ORIENTATION=-